MLSFHFLYSSFSNTVTLPFFLLLQVDYGTNCLFSSLWLGSCKHAHADTHTLLILATFLFRK